MRAGPTRIRWQYNPRDKPVHSGNRHAREKEVETGSADAYLKPEARARVRIDEILSACGWVIQDARAANLSAGRGVAIREFVLDAPHGTVDYLLYVDRQALSVLDSTAEFDARLVGVDDDRPLVRIGLGDG